MKRIFIIYTVFVIIIAALLVGYFVFGIGKRRVAVPVASTEPRLSYAITTPSQKETDGFYHTQFLVSISVPQGTSQVSGLHFSSSFRGCKILSESSASSTPETLSVDCISLTPITDTGALFSLAS
jgi:hypothetical protein